MASCRMRSPQIWFLISGGSDKSVAGEGGFCRSGVMIVLLSCASEPVSKSCSQGIRSARTYYLSRQGACGRERPNPS